MQTGRKSYSVEELNLISDGDSEFVNKMIELFVVHGSETADEMKASLLNNNYSNIALLAHRLKSTVNLLCIHSIQNEIKLLENLRKNNLTPGEIEGLVNKVRNEVYTVISEIKSE